jgi:hypothetical protein
MTENELTQRSCGLSRGSGQFKRGAKDISTRQSACVHALIATRLHSTTTRSAADASVESESH